MAKLRYDRYGNRLDEEGNPVSYSSGGTTYNPIGEVTYGGASTGGYHPSVPKSVRLAGSFRTPAQIRNDRLNAIHQEAQEKEAREKEEREERKRKRKEDAERGQAEWVDSKMEAYGLYEPGGEYAEDGQPLRRPFSNPDGDKIPVEDDIRKYSGSDGGKIQYFMDPSGRMKFVVRDPGSDHHNATAWADSFYYDGVKIRRKSKSKIDPTKLHGVRTDEKLEEAKLAHEASQGTSPEDWDLADAKFNYASGDPRGTKDSVPYTTVEGTHGPMSKPTFFKSDGITNSTAQNLRSPYSIEDEYEEDFDWEGAGISGEMAAQNLPIRPGDDYEAEMMEDFDWGYSSRIPGDTRSQEELKMAHALGDPTVTTAGMSSDDPRAQGIAGASEMKHIYEDWKEASDASQAGKNLWNMGKRGVKGVVEAAENLYDSVKESDAMDLLNPGARSPLKPTWPYIGPPEGSYLPGFTPVPEREPSREGLFKSTWPYINVGDTTATGAYMPDPRFAHDANPIYARTHFESPQYQGPVRQAEGASTERESPPTILEILANQAIQRGSRPQAAPGRPSTLEATRPSDVNASEAADPLSTQSVIERIMQGDAPEKLKQLLVRMVQQGISNPLLNVYDFHGRKTSR